MNPEASCGHDDAGLDQASLRLVDISPDEEFNLLVEHFKSLDYACPYLAAADLIANREGRNYIDY